MGSLNPIYGQGVTMSVESALMLQQEIEKNGRNLESFNAKFCTDFYSKLNASYLIPWLLCSTIDLQYDFTKTKGEPMKAQKAISGLVCTLTQCLFEAANQSEIATDYLYRVLFMEQGFRKQLFNPIWMFGYFRNLLVSLLPHA